MTAAAANLPAQESPPISLANVEQELNRRVRALQDTPDHVLLPVRMSNLIVYCDKADLAREVNELIPQILVLHPARVLLLVALPHEKENQLTTTVTVRAHGVDCDRILGTEQINLYATGTAVHKLPFIVWSLLVGDLPINLWWAANVPPPLGGELFHGLAEDAEQVIFDSIGWPDPARGMAAVANWIGHLEKTPRSLRWRLADDLNWRRLKYWRRILAQGLDPATAPGLLETVKEITIEHGPHAVIKAWELVSWLASRMNWTVQTGRVQPGVEMAWQFAAPHGSIRVRIVRMEEGKPLLYRVRVAGAKGGLNFVLGSERRLVVLPEGKDYSPRTMTIPAELPADLIARELSDRDRDPVFRASLNVARQLAQSVLHS